MLAWHREAAPASWRRQPFLQLSHFACCNVTVNNTTQGIPIASSVTKPQCCYTSFIPHQYHNIMPNIMPLHQYHAEYHAATSISCRISCRHINIMPNIMPPHQYHAEYQSCRKADYNTWCAAHSARGTNKEMVRWLSLEPFKAQRTEDILLNLITQTDDIGLT